VAENEAVAAEPMMLSEMIDLLPPVPEPAAVPWWPQTWGWALLGVAVLVAAAVFGWRRYRHWRANRYRQAALQELRQRLAAGEGAPALAEVLRRTALVAFPRPEVASLSGESWVAFLNQHTAPGQACFDAPAMAQLSRMTYRQGEDAPQGPALEELTRRVERWISTHRRDTGGRDD
tara:strand:+ start:923 stop:1450 length:528 start_codon:yes stop_codon:yes gene_type:complete